MKRWLGDAARGFCMGLAEVIPGVSGGTIALVLGVYDRLVDAVASLGPRTPKLLRNVSFLRATLAGVRRPELLDAHPHRRDAHRLLLLLALASGMLPAVLLGARALPDLLGSHPAEMRAFFLGLVLASVSVPLRRIERRTASRWLLALGAAAVTAWFVALPAPSGGHARGVVELEFASPAPPGLVLAPHTLALIAPGRGVRPDIAFGPAVPVAVPSGRTHIEVEVVARMAGTDGNLPPGSLVVGQSPLPVAVIQDQALAGGRDPALLWLFAGGLLAISAMVLPGISGSFVLLLLGLYHFVLHSLDALIFFGDPAAALRIGVFVLALATGLLTFVRVLKRLFARRRDVTLAVLAGLMTGSLRKLWPFVEITPQGAEALRWPLAGEPGTLAVGLLFLAGVVVVGGLASFSSRA